MTTSTLTLPVLDLSRLDDAADAAAFRDELREATHEFGFFYLTGHGVPQELSDRVIRTARAFFDLPEADKFAIENLKSPHFRGYTRVGGELTRGRVDWREQIDIGPDREAVVSGAEVPDYFRLQGLGFDTRLASSVLLNQRVLRRLSSARRRSTRIETRRAARFRHGPRSARSYSPSGLRSGL